MPKKLLTISTLITLTLLLAGCSVTLNTDKDEKKEEVKTVKKAQITNPATKKCMDDGGQWNVMTIETGDQIGVCTFSDGTQCEEWSYFNGKCGSKNAPQTNNSNDLQVSGSTNTLKLDVDDNKEDTGLELGQTDKPKNELEVENNDQDDKLLE